MFRCVLFLVPVFIFCTAVFPVVPHCPAQDLTEKQRSIAERYGQLEQVLFRLSEITAQTDPKRAALLKKVLLISKDKLLSVQMDNLVRLLENRRFTDSLAGQESIEKELQELLRILENENRIQRRDAEKDKIKQFLRDLEEIIHQEKSLEAKTTQREGEQLTPLEKEQQEIRLRSQTLREQMKEQETSSTPQKDSQDNPQENPSKKTDNKPENTNESKENKDSQSKDNQNKDGKEEQSQNSEKNNEEQKDDKQTDKKQSDDKQSDEKEQETNDSPQQKAMHNALERMKKAEQRLKKSEKSGAVEEQEEAVAQLQRVKAELEKILRQIREEELMQTLEKLESRFQRMLKIEQGIRRKTETLSDDLKRTDDSNRRQIEIQASQLSGEQQEVISDADAALVLLREDGTAQAMTESLLQARFDMSEVQQRLKSVKLDTAVMETEDSIIAAIQEMIDAVKEAIKEAEKRKQEPQEQQNGEGGQEEKEPLIKLLSELKMIRSMQQRVNDRTGRYDLLLDELKKEPNADFESLKQKVVELTRQQNRVSRILHDIKVGKTQ
ncbi:hypothetical protein FACS189427_10720 [Planctomycetales bacterium]|nr:hypothetical protein FACS189427_10720 [Planctomycetales bacterium]